MSLLSAPMSHQIDRSHQSMQFRSALQIGVVRPADRVGYLASMQLSLGRLAALRARVSRITCNRDHSLNPLIRTVFAILTTGGVDYHGTDATA